MTSSKTEQAGARGEPVRRNVLDAAERLLRGGKAGFSMRDLAAEAGVSFATPFNQFGSKAGIMRALSDRRIASMEVRYAAAGAAGDAADRVRRAVAAATAVMLEEPGVNRVVMSWLGAAADEPGQVWRRSTALWALALGAGEGLAASGEERALPGLSGQLALAFRGVLSFWAAGEIGDDDLAPHALDIANALLRGVTPAPA